jgi:hypothetical protein
LEKKHKEQDRAKIEEIKSGVDRWSDVITACDVSAGKREQKALYPMGHPFGESIIDYAMIINRHRITGRRLLPLKQAMPTIASVMDPAYQYLLKPESMNS